LLELKNKYDESNTDIHIDELVQLTNGYSGAEIVATCSEAVMIAIDNNCNTLQRSYLLKAISDIKPMIDQEMFLKLSNLNQLTIRRLIETQTTKPIQFLITH
jgi:SpoVK/Ycf46/Vps4 family AAA+-type ATPase